MAALATFLFADIAGFTALTEAHGDEGAAELAADFVGAVDHLLPEHRASRVKTIGDAVLLRIPEPREAVLLGLRVACDVMGTPGSPVARIGMQYGPAVERGGDWFGATVNVASRVTSEAAGGEVLLADEARAAAGDVPGVSFHERGKRRLRNISEPLQLWAAVRADQVSDELAVDPVCRMAVDPHHAVGHLLHDGVEYHFCSLDCAGRFAANASGYVGRDTSDASSETS